MREGVTLRWHWSPAAACRVKCSRSCFGGPLVGSGGLDGEDQRTAGHQVSARLEEDVLAGSHKCLAIWAGCGGEINDTC